MTLGDHKVCMDYFELLVVERDKVYHYLLDVDFELVIFMVVEKEVGKKEEMDFVLVIIMVVVEKEEGNKGEKEEMEVVVVLIVAVVVEDAV